MADLQFASVDDYTARYGSVDDEEQLEALLYDAECMLLTAYHRRYGEDWEEGAHAAFDLNACAVACAIAHRALSVPSGMDGATSATMMAGSYSQTISWSNPTGDLWLSKSDLRRLGLAGGSRMGGTAPVAVTADA